MQTHKSADFFNVRFRNILCLHLWPGAVERYTTLRMHVYDIQCSEKDDNHWVA